VGQEFLVNGIQENNQEFAAVGAWSGGYVVAWESFPDFEGRGIFARRFDSNGIPLGDQFLVSASDAFQREPRVAVRDGGFLITWLGGGTEVDDDILGRNYVVPEPGAATLGLAALSTLAVLGRRRRSRPAR
jgi:uncharacterized protein (TIGR03382 family)